MTGNRSFLFSALLLIAAVGGCGKSPDPVDLGLFSPSDDETLVWSDEFDGTGLDPAKWTPQIGTGCPSLCGWGNNELQYYRAENATVEDGFLKITAKAESFGGRNYTSARINTQNLFTAERGRFEARIKLPIGRGIWPAFWMLGADIGSVGWPRCGEIDVMEYRGHEPNVLHGSLHGPGYSGGAAITGRTVLPGSEGFDADFHVFAVDWGPDRITWLLDGEPYQTFGPSDLPNGSAWVFDHPFFIILNVAVGGYFPGNPDQSTRFPQEMVVDWVRVYEPE